MKFFYTLIIALSFCTVSFSQRTATASAGSDFKTIKAGFVESALTLDQPLTAEESTQILNWAKGNEPNIYITISADQKQLSVKLTEAYNQRGAYEKLFYQINVESIVAMVNGKPVSLSIESFIEKFNL